MRVSEQLDAGRQDVADAGTGLGWSRMGPHGAEWVPTEQNGSPRSSGCSARGAVGSLGVCVCFADVLGDTCPLPFVSVCYH